MSSLRTRVGSLEFENPSMVASGIMDETGLSMVRILQSGAGAAVSKSVGTNPNPGHANPNFIEVNAGCINAMGLPNPGIEAFAEEMEVATKEGTIIGSIYGGNADEFAKLAGRMEDFGACAVELNLSCPHAKGYGIEVGTDPKLVKTIVSSVKAAVDIPVWAKLTPNTHILTDIGQARVRARRRETIGIILGRNPLLPQNTYHRAECVSSVSAGSKVQSRSNRSPAKRVRFDQSFIFFHLPVL